MLAPNALTRRLAGGRLLVLLIVFSTLIGAACSGESATEVPGENAPPGKPETRSVDVGTGFTHIDASDGWTVDLSVGDKESVQIQVDSDATDHVSAEVVQGALKLRAEAGVDIGFPPQATVTMPRLTLVTLSGGAELKVSGPLDGDELTAQLSQAGKLQGEDVKLTTAMFAASENSTVSFKSGSIGTLGITASSASTFALAKVTSKSVTATLTQGSTATVGAIDNLTATASDDSHLGYAGSPVIAKQDTSTGATIRRRQDS